MAIDPRDCRHEKIGEFVRVHMGSHPSSWTCEECNTTVPITWTPTWQCDPRTPPATLRDVISDILNSKLGACTDSCLDSLTVLVEQERRKAVDDAFGRLSGPILSIEAENQAEIWHLGNEMNRIRRAMFPPQQ